MNEDEDFIVALAKEKFGIERTNVIMANSP